MYQKVMGRWKVKLSGMAKKADKLLSNKAHKSFTKLIKELQNGPIVQTWPHYEKLVSDTHHCHLNKGYPIYIARWTSDRKNKTIEVYYAGIKSIS